MFAFNNSSFNRIVSNLSQLSTELAISNERLTTGKRINRAMDDPAGIVSVSRLNGQIAKIDGITTAGQRINDIINTADSGMNEISTLLDTIETNVNAAVGADAEDIATYQANIDEALDGIDRLVNTTKFNGKSLLNGTLGYSVSVPESDKITDIRITSANTGSSDQTVNVGITDAEVASVQSNTFSFLPGDVTLAITGPDGSANVNLLNGWNRETIRDEINSETGNTGIVATIDGGTIVLSTQNEGSDQSVSVAVTSGVGNMAWEGQSSASDTGTDFVVTVNGSSVNVDNTTKRATFNTNGMAGELTFTEAFYGGGSGSTTFTVSGDGAGWSLGAGGASAVHFGQSPMTTSMLGNSVIGYLNSLRAGGDNDLASGNLDEAADIASLASSQVARSRARLGAIQNYTVNTTLNALADTKTSLQDSLTAVEEIDYTEETANNNRLQLLMQMGTTVLATLNTNSSNVLSLLSSAWIS